MTRRTPLLTVLGALLVVGGAVAAFFALRGGEGEIERAPAFGSAPLAAPPGADWITNGGSLSNERYSPLAQIDVSNVAHLRGVWQVHLGSGGAGKYSGEAQPLVYR